MKTMTMLQGRVSAPGVLLVTFISATIALTALAGTPTCAPAPPGLVGWWAGEGNANDSAGTNNGALYGGMSFAAGEVGQAFDFDGSSGYVEIPASASLNVGAGAGLTFECWIKPAALAAAQPVAEWNSGDDAGLHLWISQPPPYGGGPGSIYVNLIDTTGAFHTLSTGAGILNTNGFQHLALSYDKASGMASLYYNGALVALAMLGSFTPQTSFDLYLGKLVSDAPSVAFQGLMDEASLYSRALTAAEVQAIYNAGSAGKCPLGAAPTITTQPASQMVVAGSNATFTVTATGTPPLSYQWQFIGTNLAGATSTSLTLSNVQPAQAGNYTMLVTNAYGSALSSNAVLTVNQASGCTTPPADLVSWWRGEGNALDQIGLNNGVLINGAGFGAGVVGQAFAFNASSNSYVEVADSPSLELTKALTWECWAKRLNTSQVHTLVEKGGSWTGGQTEFESSLNDTYAGGAHFGFACGSGWRGCAVTPDTAWHHYAAVAVSGQANPTLYIDGVPQPIVFSGGPAMMSFYPSTRALHIGALLDPETGWFYYSDTLIDELSIYNRALSAAEIQAIYNAGSAGKCIPGVVPSVSVQPASQTVLAGSNVTFTATATGTLPLSYQWQFNGTNLAGATSTSLTLSDVQPAQAGNYTMLVTNAYGLALSSNAVLTVNQALNCATPPAGLVSWWRGEGNALDQAGGNNGVLMNGAGFGAGMVGQAFALNASSNSYVQVADSPTLELTNAVTLECWAKRLNTSQVHILAEKGGDYTGGQTDYEFTLNDNYAGGSVGFSSGGCARSCVVTPDTAWHHYAAVAVSGQADPILYIDGVPQTITLRSGAATMNLVASTRALHLGAQVDPQTGWFYYSDTLIDELSIYNRALSAAEIQAIYNAGSAGKCLPGVAPSISAQPASQTVLAGSNVTFTATATGTLPLSYQWQFNGTNLAGATGTSVTLSNVQPAQAGNYAMLVTNAYGSALSSNAVLTVNQALNCATPPAGLVSWWRGEGNALDQAGGNNGVLMNGAGFGAGMVGQAFAFNASSNSYVQVADSPTLRFPNALTIECWAKRLNASQVHVLAEKGGDWTGGQTDFHIALNDTYAGGKHFAFSFAGGWRGCAVVPDTAWHHYAAVAVNGQANPILYIDGVAQTIAYSGGQATMNLFASTRALHIGAQVDPQTGWFYYSDTLVDELAIYNRALSASEVQSVYNAGSAGKCPLGVAPTITTQPASQTVVAGSNATFTVTATGTPPLSYQWCFNGTNIAGATANSLTLSNVQPAQSGNYAVLVTNTYGSAISSNAVLTVNQPTNCTPSPAALIGWWRGEGNGNDSAGTNNAYALPNVSFTNGIVGQAFAFDPENLPYGTYSGVRIADQPAYALTNSLSIEAWIRPRGDGYVIFYRGDNRSGLDPYTMSMGLNNILSFGITDANGNSAGVSAPLVYNQWWHVAGTLDGASGNLSLYTNGSLAAQITTTVRPFGALIPGDSPGIGIGNVNDGFNNFPFQGDIDEVSLYSRALSGAEIAGIYGAGSAGKCGLPPSILTQPLSQVAAVGSNITFTVTAGGTPPLGYQWQLSGTNLAGATGTSLTLMNVQAGSAGSYSVLVTNAFGAVTSQVATLTVLVPTPQTLLDVNFAAYSRVKVGFAGTGQTTNDFWNNYTAPFESFAGLSNLAMADGTPTTVGLTVQNGAGHWSFTHPDLMYCCYCYSQDNGDIILTVTNLPSGQYDFYLYGHAGTAISDTVFQLLVGGADYGNWATSTNSDSLWTNFVAGAQYVVYRNVAVTNGGAPVTIMAHPGSSGYALLNGMQISSAAGAGQVQTQAAQIKAVVPSGSAGSTMQLQVRGAPSRVYVIQASTNLIDWVTIGLGLTDTDGNVEFTDPNAANQPLRFYRVVGQ